MKISNLLFVLILLSVIIAVPKAYTASIYAPAVIESQNVGALTLLKLNVTSGTGNVTVTGPTNVSADTLASAQTAAEYAMTYLGLTESNYNFNYMIDDQSPSVSGPSAGLAFTLLTISALQQKQLAPNFTVTGTISPNGTVGQIGGIYDKVGAAKAGGMRFLLVPASSGLGFDELLYYLSQQVYHLPVMEVANVSQALPYAFGTSLPQSFSLNLTRNYSLTALGNANATCTNCNESVFSSLLGFTFNYTRSYISNMSSNFSVAKQQLLENMNAYETLANRGYEYTAANFAFLDSIYAFTLSNSNNLDAENASTVLSGISSYCSSLIPPPLTDNNYEQVTGGKLRQLWGNITIGNAESLLSVEQTTDDMVQALYTGASALGWCKAADEEFLLASFMGGNYVQASPTLRSNVVNAINIARSYGTGGIYIESALQAYNSGDYITALYAATYADVFNPSVSDNTTVAQLYSDTLSNIANATSGMWPSKFAAHSEFYFRESIASQGLLERYYAIQAYTTSLLAKSIATANLAITNSFIASNGSVSGFPASVALQIDRIEQSISQIYQVLLIDTILLFAVLVALLVHLTSNRRNGSTRKRRR